MYAQGKTIAPGRASAAPLAAQRSPASPPAYWIFDFPSTVFGASITGDALPLTVSDP